MIKKIAIAFSLFAFMNVAQAQTYDSKLFDNDPDSTTVIVQGMMAPMRTVDDRVLFFTVKENHLDELQYKEGYRIFSLWSIHCVENTFKTQIRRVQEVENLPAYNMYVNDNDATMHFLKLEMQPINSELVQEIKEYACNKSFIDVTNQ